MRRAPNIVKQTTVSPPTAPPTIAPTFVNFGCGGEAVKSGVEAGGETAGVLRLETREGVDCISVEVDLTVSLDLDVVDACTVLGTASKMSVFPSFPQAIYSYD